MRQTVLRHPLEHWVEPSVAFEQLFGDRTDTFWLDSSIHALGGMSYIGAGSRRVTSDDTDVLALLRAELPAPIVSGDAQKAHRARGFALGWIGWLGYDLRSRTMGEPGLRPSRYPDAAMLFVDRAIEFDHAAGEVTLIALGANWTEELTEWRDSTIATIAAPHFRRHRAPRTQNEGAPPSIRWRYTDAEYLAMIEECRAAIVAGDAYQLCLTTEVDVDIRPDPLVTYLALRAASPTHHGALLRIGDVALLSSSPEQFLAVSPDGIVSSSPIKGTRRRDPVAAVDDELRAELAASEKERAENLMIVDLMRNDISRVSAVGTVEVTSLLSVESYAQVHQLVSTVRGSLAPGLTGMDAVEACFPAGSMTGAPKLAATRILDRLEARARGIYAGAFGYFGLDGRIDLAMVIRTIVIDGAGTTIGSGGGITALSVPADELDEVRLKARALLSVLGVTGSSGGEAGTTGRDEGSPTLRYS